jgi:hypothetical protein
MRNAYKIVDRKPEGRKSFGIPRHNGRVQLKWIEIFGNA